MLKFAINKQQYKSAVIKPHLVIAQILKNEKTRLMWHNPILLDTVTLAGKSGLRILWDFAISHWEWLTGILSTVGTFLFVSLRKAKKWIREMNLLKQELPEIKSVLFEIRDQFRTNGGSSLRDRVDSLGKKIALIGNIAWSEREMSEDGFFVTNETGEWIDCNKALLKRVNATKEDVLKNGWRGFLAHSTAESTIHQYETIIEEQRSGDLPCSFRRDLIGSVWHFNLYIQLMKNDGRIIGYTGLLKLKP